MAATGQLIFHHLSNSQSHRILWLLEELETTYVLDAHNRNESGDERGRAPVELQKTHPLGKAPQLTTPDGRTISESLAIAKYLIVTYDSTGKFKGDGHGNDWIRDEELCSVAGTSLGQNITIDFIFTQLSKRSPFFIRPLFNAAHKQLQKLFLGPEVAKLCSYLDDQLGHQDYFMGVHPGCSDIIISWPIDFLAHMCSLVKLADYPKLSAWNARCKARPAWKRSIAKGNGYFGPGMDLDFVG